MVHTNNAGVWIESGDKTVTVPHDNVWKATHNLLVHHLHQLFTNLLAHIRCKISLLEKKIFCEEVCEEKT